MKFQLLIFALVSLASLILKRTDFNERSLDDNMENIDYFEGEFADNFNAFDDNGADEFRNDIPEGAMMSSIWNKGKRWACIKLLRYT